jgi:hypothetical protein
MLNDRSAAKACWAVGSAVFSRQRAENRQNRRRPVPHPPDRSRTGITLQDRLNYSLDISFQEQRRILNAILDALDNCHRNSILHRNLTPSCIYLANDGTVKLGDLDFARVPDLSTTLTITGEPLPVQAGPLYGP